MIDKISLDFAVFLEVTSGNFDERILVCIVINPILPLLLYWFEFLPAIGASLKPEGDDRLVDCGFIAVTAISVEDTVVFDFEVFRLTERAVIGTHFVFGIAPTIWGQTVEIVENFGAAIRRRICDHMSEFV